MKKINVFLFLFFPLLLLADWDSIFSDDEDPLICNHVNVISGNLSLAYRDTLIKGAVPYPLIRTYSSSGAFERLGNTDQFLRNKRNGLIVQGGWSWLPHVNLFYKESTNPSQIFLSEPSGNLIIYEYVYTESKNLLVFKPKVSDGQHAGMISGRSNPQNNLIKVDNKKMTFHVYLADGGERIYHGSKKLFPGGNFFRLVFETLPSGHSMNYFYDKSLNLNLITIGAPNNKKVFSEIKFDYVRTERPLAFRIKTSEGNTLEYTSLEFEKRDYINRVSSNFRPFEMSHYIPSRKGLGARIKSVELGGKSQLQVTYYKPRTKKEENKWLEKEKVKPFHIDKVSSVQEAIGDNGGLITTARFEYSSDCTNVRDIENLLTRYHYHDGKILSIEHFGEKDHFFSDTKYLWENGFLKSKTFITEKGPEFSKTFLYDDKGNVIKETFSGNITGMKDSSSDGESFSRYFEFLPKYNVPTLEKEDEGPTYLYKYKPNSNLLSAKFTLDDKIIIREFFFYNEDNFLVEEIIDDGLSENPDDLSSVTERKIKHYELNDIGLVTYLKESFLDLTTLEEKQLKKTKYTYNDKRLVISETVFDSNDKERYTINTQYDAMDRVTFKTTPLGQENTFLYDISGNLIESKEVGSPKKIYTYKCARQPISCEEIDEDGNKRTTLTSYDNKGRLISKTDWRGNTIYQNYDCFGRCTQNTLPKVKDENGLDYAPTIFFTYDTVGNLISTTNPEGHTFKTVYNSLQKPLCQIQPDGSKTYYFYNLNGSLAKEVYPDDTVVEYTYDKLHRLIEKSIYSKNELLSLEKWVYSAFHLVSYTDPRSLVTSYFYDGAGRKILEKRDKQEKRFFYDELGFLQKVTEGDCSHTEMHDVGGRVVEVWEDNGEKIENHMYFTYDKENRKQMAKRITSAGEAIDYFSFDSEGRLICHTDPYGNKLQYITGSI